MVLHSFYMGIRWSNVLIKRFDVNIFKFSCKNTCTITQLLPFDIVVEPPTLMEKGLLKIAKPVSRSLKSVNISSIPLQPHGFLLKRLLPFGSPNY